MSDRFGREYILFAPVVWLGVAFIAWWIGRMSAGAASSAGRDRAGWLQLAAVLIGAGVIGPDSLGADSRSILAAASGLARARGPGADL